MTGVAVQQEVVSKEQWIEARKALLAKEKEFSRTRDELNRSRRELPWVKVDKKYVFDTPNGKKSLSDLFEGRSQLIVYHFMLGPGWEEGCRSCSLLADHFDGMTVHLTHRNTSFIAASRAPLPQIEAFKKRMGWRFNWVSSNGSDFNFDYNVSFTDNERVDGKVYYNYGMREFPLSDGPGLSVFYRDESGEIFHAYSTFSRGLDILIGAYNYLDLTPKGRDEEELAFSMAWVRHHDRYDDSYALDKTARYVPPRVAAECCHAEEKTA